MKSKLRNSAGFIALFFSLVFRLNYYEGIDKPNLWQWLFAWRISPKTAWDVASIIWFRDIDFLTSKYTDDEKIYPGKAVYIKADGICGKCYPLTPIPKTLNPKNYD